MEYVFQIHAANILSSRWIYSKTHWHVLYVFAFILPYIAQLSAFFFALSSQLMLAHKLHLEISFFYVLPFRTDMQLRNASVIKNL